MVLILEDDYAVIQVTDEMPEGKGEKYVFSLPQSSSVQDLFKSVTSQYNYVPQSYNLLLVNDFGNHEMTHDGEKSLKQAGLLFGADNQNCMKIIPPKAKSPPSIVISLANKAGHRHRDSDSARARKGLTTRPRIRENASTPSRYVGLVNQAMTCYLNSLLQALYMTPEFRNALYKWKYTGSSDEAQKSIPYQLQRLFLNLQTSKRSAIETSKLTKSFGWDASDSWQQHDIQELCRVMFDALEQKFKDTDQADFINNLYQGKLIDYVQCLECRTEKTRIDTFLDIPLPVRPFGSTVAYNSVAEAMHAFIQPETLDGNNQYSCETCNKKCDAHKGLKFSHFPYILTLHLKRFDFDYNAMSRIKLTDRVEFPNVLNINGFLCDEAKALIKHETKSSVNNGISISEEINGSGSVKDACEPSTKGDDTSITDSSSTLEDEGCQGTEPSDTMEHMHGSTSGSNSSGSNVDMQDYDEGIDLSNGTQSQQENEKNRRHTEKDGPPGPYIYELFSIMIHSGSASGGHYYVYIKDFDKGEWFCFDDQSVSRITNEDISMTFGGGTHRGYYSGAHSSSTSAYMLMYRQIDKNRNQSVMSIDEFPPHMKELMKAMQEEEEEARILQERDRDRLKIKVYCRVPGDDQRFEAKLVIDGDTTLAEATDIAHKLFILDGIVPIEQCRLVSYDSLTDTIDCSFDDQESETMSYINSNTNSQNPNAQSLYLEIREADAQFEPYRSGGVVIKVYWVHMDTKEVDPPIDVHTQLTTSFGEMRHQIAKALKLSPHIKLMMEKYGIFPIDLDDDKNLQSAGFNTSNKIFVTEVSDSQPEAVFLDKMISIIERFSNTITLYCTLPDTDKESLIKLGIAPLSASDVLRLSNGEYEAAGDSVFTPLPMAKVISRGTSPQLPALDGEEECLGAAGCSDQSTSEDSSLTDSDRTIVGDETEFCLAELSSASNSPDQPNVSSPEEKESSPILAMKKGDKVIAAEKDGESLTDEEMLNSHYYYLKIHPCKTQDQKKMVRVQIDKRMKMGTLKLALAQHMGISADYIKLFRKCGNNELPCSRLQDPLKSLRDEEKIIVRLERALQTGEYRGKVYQLLADDEPIKFLCDWILTKEMLVGEAKKQLLDELKRKEELDIPYDRCRLRIKKWKNPGKIFLDSQSFQELGLTSNWEIFLQELSEPENVTSPSQVTIMLRNFNAFDSSLDGFHEITLQSSSFTELRETLSETSGIPLDSLEFARPLGNFPFIQLNNNKVQRDFLWESVCNCNLSDGTVLYYRNKDDDGSSYSNDKNDLESGKEYKRTYKYSSPLNSKLRRNLNRGICQLGASDEKKDRKERALRIVVSPSSNSTKENSASDE